MITVSCGVKIKTLLEDQLENSPFAIDEMMELWHRIQYCLNGMCIHGLGGGRSSPSFDGILEEREKVNHFEMREIKGLKFVIKIISIHLFPLRTPRADVVREEADIPENIVV